MVSANKDVRKIIALLFPHDSFDWDETSVWHVYDIIKACRPLIKKEKWAMIYDEMAISIIKRNCFFDLDHNFNDTLNSLSKSLTNLIDSINN